VNEELLASVALLSVAGNSLNDCSNEAYGRWCYYK
jgi:hypothetical protein